MRRSTIGRLPSGPATPANNPPPSGQFILPISAATDPTPSGHSTLTRSEADPPASGQSRWSANVSGDSDTSTGQHRATGNRRNSRRIREKHLYPPRNVTADLV